MRECPKCRSQINENVNLCSVCGFQFFQQFPPITQEPSEPTSTQQSEQFPPITQEPSEPTSTQQSEQLPPITQKSFEPISAQQPEQFPPITKKPVQLIPIQTSSFKKKLSQKSIAIFVVLGMILMFCGVVFMVYSIPTESRPEKPITPKSPDEPEKSYIKLIDDEPVLSDYNIGLEPKKEDYITQSILNAEPDPADYDYDNDGTIIDLKTLESYISIYGDTFNDTSNSTYQLYTFYDNSTMSLVKERKNLSNLPKSANEVGVYKELSNFLTDYKNWKETEYDGPLKSYTSNHENWENENDVYTNAHNSWEKEYNESYKTWEREYQRWLEHEYKHWDEVEFPLWEQRYSEWENDSAEWEEKNRNDEYKTANVYQKGMIIHDLGAIISSSVLMFVGLSFKEEDISIRKIMIMSGTVILVVMFAIPLGFSYLIGL